MRVKIWGARGSIPTPVRPEEIREKIISAILNIPNIERGELREEILSAILVAPQPASDIASQFPPEADEAYRQRREAVAAYLDSLSPLLAGTAGGNTPCIEIRAEDDLFIIDAGSGIRDLGLELMKGPCGQGQGVIHLFFSHPHWDHIQGFPFFRPAFIPGNKIFIYGVHDMEVALRRQQEAISFPVSLDYMQATIEFVTLKPGQVCEFGDLRIRNIRNEHPGDAYSFRFEKGNKVFVYASDAAYPAGSDMHPYLNFFLEADVLIYDAQFTQRESDEKEDWGHSSSLVGVEMAQQAKVKTLVLFHYDPTYSDQELEKILEDTLKFQQNQYPNHPPVKVIIAQEGQTFDLTPTHTIQLQQVPGGKAAILKPAGIFNEQVATRLREQLDELKQNVWPSQLIIDMSGVEMLQVTGLRALVKLRKEQPGIPLVLAGPSINVQQLIDLTGYSDLFAIYPSVHAAFNALQARETLNLPGQMIKNRYYIEAKIGDGLLGTVFKAIDTRLNRPVAIKILSPSFSEGAIEQFLQQARQIINLIHPNVVEVYECDEDHGLSFMAEEFIESKTLQDMLDENPGQPLPFNVALSIAENIARALEYAHAYGVIHGDLKPKNVLLADEVKISDFGLGRLETGTSLINLDVPLTLMTPHYLAPEQILGHPIDARTDLYALGVILYELFTGQCPFKGSDQQVLEHHRSSFPRPPRELNPALSYSLEHLILKLLDKDPNKRYATARQIRAILAGMTTITSGETGLHNFTRQQWPPFVNRAEPLHRLTALWEKTWQGQGQLVFITGEAGIGKTRLVRELAQRAGDAVLLMGACQKQESSRAYQPFIEVLRAYFASVSWSDRIPTSLAEVAYTPVGQILSQMVRVIPEINHLMPNIFQTTGQPAPAYDTSTADGDTQANATAEPVSISLAQSIAQATKERPWLLILDDLHLADPGSLKLLQYLARHCSQMGLMIVGLYRDSELENNKFLIETLDSLKQDIDYTSVKLERLTDKEVKKLLKNIWPQTVPGDLVAAIYRRTEGNPFYIEEIAKGLMDEGVVSWRDGRWRFAPVVEMGLPQGIRDTVLRRINRLTKETQTLLNQAAMLGPTFKFADLHEMSDLSKWDALESLDVALERQFISQTPSERMLRFNHVAIQEILYKNLSPLKRRVIHLEAGEALERRNLPEPKYVAEALAYHFFQARELEKGLIYSIQAATQVDAIYANHTALFWYTQALDALDHLGLDRTTRQQRFELLLARERIYGYLGQRKTQAADLTMLQTLAQTLNDPAKQALAHHRRAIYERVTGHFREAVIEAEASLAVARQANDPVLAGESLIELGYIVAGQGQLETAGEHLHAAQKILKETGRRDSEAQSLNGLGAVYRHLNDYAQAENYCQQALAMSQSIGNWHGQVACLNNLAALSLATGHYTGAISYCRQALEIDWLIGDRQAEAICLNHLAMAYKELGHFEMAQTYIKQAYVIHQNIEAAPGQAEALRVWGAINLARGDYVAARDHAGEALEICQHVGLRAQEGHTWLELGLALEALDDLNKASVAYNQAQTIYREVENQPGEFEARTGLARCLLAAGKPDEAQQEIEACLAWTNSHDTSGLKYPVRLYLTAYWVLQAANKKQEAIVALQEGYALFQKRMNDIDDSELRTLFEENVPENKELCTQLKLSRG